MQADFWHRRWRKNEIGFHKSQTNPLLLRYEAILFHDSPFDKKEQVFVPLCGKTQDMRHLLDVGKRVIGTELSQTAVSQFFLENERVPRRFRLEATELWQSDGILIHQGDHFSLNPVHLANCFHIYDRAALVALPPDMRDDYVKHLFSLFPNGFSLLLITFDYAQREMEGPPFAVTQEEVQQRFADCGIRLLESRDLLPEEPRFAAKGLTHLQERAYHIVYRPGALGHIQG